MRIWQGICLSAVLLGSFASLAQAANPEDEYKKLIRVNVPLNRPLKSSVPLNPSP